MFTHSIVLLVAGLAMAAPDRPTPDQPAPDPQLTIDRNESRRTLSLEYGPMELPAGVAYAGELLTISVEVPMPVNGWLRSFEIELRHADGRPVEALLLHHAGLFAPNRRDLFSPAMERVVAFGQETEAIRLPGQLGYRVEPGDTLLLLGALYNTSDVSYEGLTLGLEMVYADAGRDVRHMDILPLYLDVMPPGNRVYEVPPGVSSRSLEWSPAIDGRILALGGHLHQYGQALILENLTTGDTIWVGSATHSDDGDLLGVSRKIFGRGHPMRADHLYRITAIYDNPTGEVIRGAMGKIGGVFMPDRGEELPAVDRADPDFIRDWHAMAHHEHEHEHVRAAEQRVPSGGR